MAEVQWREDGLAYKAEVNGWGVTVEPSIGDSAGDWTLTVGGKCPCCERGETQGFGYARTLSGAKAKGIELAQGRKPPKYVVPKWCGEKVG